MKHTARLTTLCVATLAITMGSGCMLAALGAIGAFAALSSGAHTESIEIDHPANVGYLEQNVIQQRYADAEATYALPVGSLTDEVSMVTLTPSEACFQVHVRNRDEHAARYVDLRQWRMGIDTSEDLEMGPTAFQPDGPQSAAFRGRRPRQVVNGYTTQCVSTDPNTGACRQWQERPNYATVYDPAVITVVTGGGRVCFAHRGRITAHTEWIKLSLVSPDDYEMGFEWDFRDPPAAPPPRATAQARRFGPHGG